MRLEAVRAGWAGLRRRAYRWHEQAVEPRWLLIRWLPAAGAGLVTLLVAVNLMLGLLPVAFVVATSAVVGRVPDAVTGEAGSTAWRGLAQAFVVAAVIFTGQQMLTQVQDLLGTLVQRRVDGRIVDRLLLVAARSTGIGPMEDQPTLAALKEATLRLRQEGETPGLGCAASLALVARYLRMAGFAALVGAVAGWPIAVALLAAAMTFRYGQRGGLRKYSHVWVDLIPLSRRADYLADLAMGDKAAKEIRVFGLARWLAARYDTDLRTWLARVWRERRRIYLWPYFGYTVAGLAVGVAVMVALGTAAAAGELTLTEFALGAQATVAVLLLGEHYPESDVQTQLGMLATVGIRRFEDLVGAAGTGTAKRDPAAVPPAGPTRAGPPAPARVRFQNVSFRYPGSERTVLDGLELELTAGQCTAVVGLNGAGKTTLVKLLARLYEPAAGTITVDGVDIRTLPIDRWRRQLSVVFQDFVRYELSAADNIAFGAVHAPRNPGAIRQAAASAGILHRLEQLPGGLDTPLSRSYVDGIDLSGGEWQRIAIARCLYAIRTGARVVVLDEPTAALDVLAEARFFDRFVELTHGATGLLISHRFSSVRRAHRIVVIAGGRVIEQGNHDQLMAHDGRYASLFRLQAARFTAAAAKGQR